MGGVPALGARGFAALLGAQGEHLDSGDGGVLGITDRRSQLVVDLVQPGGVGLDRVLEVASFDDTYPGAVLMVEAASPWELAALLDLYIEDAKAALVRANMATDSRR